MGEVATDTQAQEKAREILRRKAEEELKRVVGEIKKVEIMKRVKYNAPHWDDQLKRVRQLFEDARVPPKRLFEVSEELERLVNEIREKRPDGSGAIFSLSTARERFLVLAAR